ncbi:MAG: hypothetical protein C0425_03705 [Chlorobiaceae bacterium]|nr:hypothetical protein [Chlorobiaceae bacterium]MBA4309420.1 hypothetical protein [Chlorobiaceae bacterium]
MKQITRYKILLSILAGIILLLLSSLYLNKNHYHYFAKSTSLQIFENPYLHYLIVLTISSILFLGIVAILRNEKIENSFVFKLLALAVLMRIILIPIFPAGSDDVFRYIWDGKQIAHGINPYQYTPSDSALVSLHSDLLPKMVNFQNMKTIYPPVSQLMFLLGYLIGGESYIGFKIVLFFFEIATLFLLFLILRELKIEIKYILVYALSPLALSQFMIDAHLDALGFPLILLFVYFYLKQKEALSGIVLGISISIKIVSVILVPLLLKNFFKFRYYWLVIIPIFTFALTYIPFISPSVFPFEALTKFAEHWYFNGVVFTIFYELTINNQTARIICLILFVGIYTLIFFSKKSFIEKTYLIFFSFFILAPTVHPWYLGWFAILLPFHFRWSGVVWTASVSLAFYAIFNSKTFGEWHLPNIFLLIQYLPVGILFIYEMFFSRKQKVIL